VKETIEATEANWKAMNIVVMEVWMETEHKEKVSICFMAGRGCMIKDTEIDDEYEVQFESKPVSFFA
jgi:hypothetical protein